SVKRRRQRIIHLKLILDELEISHVNQTVQGKVMVASVVNVAPLKLQHAVKNARLEHLGRINDDKVIVTDDILRLKSYRIGFDGKIRVDDNICDRVRNPRFLRRFGFDDYLEV